MISAEKVTNNKVVELIKIYNFYFGHFFIRQSDSTRCRMKKWPKYLSDEEMTKIKVVDLDEFYK
jgi:hypothetical protein